MTRCTSRRLLTAFAALLTVPGCGTRAPAPAAAPPAPVQRTSTVDTVARPVEQVLDPARYLEVLEDHLVHRPSSTVAFRITSEGAFSASLAGEMALLREGEVRLAARGTFGADSVALSLRTAGGRLVGGNGARSFDQPVPPQLREALVVGMMRMGLLHNLARLVAVQPPDRADGTVRSWLELKDVAWLPRDTAATRRGLTYALWVAGTPSGDGTLWLDGRGRPVARELLVRFAQGEMRVREEYEVR